MRKSQQEKELERTRNKTKTNRAKGARDARTRRWRLRRGVGAGGPGTRASSGRGGSRGQYRRGGSHAPEACAFPQPASLLRGSRTLGGGGGVEAAARSGRGRRAGVWPPPQSPAGPAASALTPQAAEGRPRFPPSGPGPGARRRGPAPSRTPASLRGALSGEGLLLRPAKAGVHFYRGGGRGEASFGPDWNPGRKLCALPAPRPPPEALRRGGPGPAFPAPGPAAAPAQHPPAGAGGRGAAGPAAAGGAEGAARGHVPVAPALRALRGASSRAEGSSCSLNEVSRRQQSQEGSPLSVKRVLCLLHLSIWYRKVPGEGFFLPELQNCLQTSVSPVCPGPCENWLRSQEL
nr:spidroin-2-like [Equus asinus]